MKIIRTSLFVPQTELTWFCKNCLSSVLVNRFLAAVIQIPDISGADPLDISIRDNA
jgi:hypothetical protein